MTLAGLVLLFGLLPIAPQQADATFPGHPGLIVFNKIEFQDSGVAFSGGLFAIRPGEERLRQLTDTPMDYDPSFAPSGKRLVFRRSNDPGGGIYTLDLRTGTTTPITSRASDLDPAFGPDGMVVFSRFVGRSEYDLFLRGGNDGLRRLTSDSAADQEAVFTPDGRRVIFSRSYRSAVPLSRGRSAPGRDGLYSIRIDGTGLKFLRGVGRGGSNFDVAPDGSHLLFNVLGKVTMDSVESEARTQSLDGGKSRIVSRDAMYSGYSPDGRRIAYSNYQGLWVCRADGSGSPTLLLETDYLPYQEGGSLVVQPTWQPLP